MAPEGGVELESQPATAIKFGQLSQSGVAAAGVQ